MQRTRLIGTVVHSNAAATFRAHAIGGPQWLRTPPPIVRETSVPLAPYS
jgi:hypothetical protein